MCLSIPARVVEVREYQAVVEVGGERRTVRLGPDPIERGDYVLTHLGMVTGKVPPEQVEETLALFEEIAAVISGEGR